MSKFPFQMVLFGADDKIFMGGIDFLDPDAGGVLSEQAALETAVMCDAKVLGIYERATGDAKLIPVSGNITPAIEVIWQQLLTRPTLQLRTSSTTD